MVKISTSLFLFSGLGILFLLSSIFISLLWLENFGNTSGSEQKILVLLDVSESMDTKDMPGGESRLFYAQKYIMEAMKRNPKTSFALDIFAGSYQKVLPHTDDPRIMATFLRGISSKSVYEKGSDLHGALERVIEYSDDSDIFVMTDGSDENIELPDGLRSILHQNNSQIVFVGFGSHKGSYIPTGDPFSPYKLYKREVVVTKLNEYSLQNIASQLGGRYKNAREEIPPMQKNTMSNTLAQNIVLLMMLLSIFCMLTYTFYKQKYEK